MSLRFSPSGFLLADAIDGTLHVLHARTGVCLQCLLSQDYGCSISAEQAERVTPCCVAWAGSRRN